MGNNHDALEDRFIFRHGDVFYNDSTGLVESLVASRLISATGATLWAFVRAVDFFADFLRLNVDYEINQGGFKLGCVVNLESFLGIMKDSMGGSFPEFCFHQTAVGCQLENM